MEAEEKEKRSIDDIMGTVEDKGNTGDEELVDAIEKLKEILKKGQEGNVDTVGFSGEIKAKVYDEDGNVKNTEKIEF